MSANQKVLIAARRSLIVLAVGLTVTASVYFGARYLAEQVKLQLQQSQQLQSQNEASLQQKQADALSLRAEIKVFNTLREQGVVGMAEREGWVEQLVASRERMGLPNTLTYTLRPPQPLAQQGVDASAASAEPGAVAEASGDPLFHDLEFQVKGIHEGELLAFLSAYRAQVKGRFRVNECSLTEPLEDGLFARCTLRFFTLPGDGTKGGPS
jgi:hypothetical protein